jgi:tRNA 2-thiouridine synthesizing protein A
MHVTDARGLRCPMPLVMAKTAMETVPAGQELTVLATDPEAAIDLAAWAADRGYAMTERARKGWTEYVLRSSSPA